MITVIIIIDKLSILLLIKDKTLDFHHRKAGFTNSITPKVFPITIILDAALDNKNLEVSKFMF